MTSYGKALAEAARGSASAARHRGRRPRRTAPLAARRRHRPGECPARDGDPLLPPAWRHAETTTTVAGGASRSPASSARARVLGAPSQARRRTRWCRGPRPRQWSRRSSRIARAARPPNQRSAISGRDRAHRDRAANRASRSDSGVGVDLSAAALATARRTPSAIGVAGAHRLPRG